MEYDTIETCVARASGWVKLTSFLKAVGANRVHHTGRDVDGTQESKLWRVGPNQRKPRLNTDYKPMPGNRGGGWQRRAFHAKPEFLKQVWRKSYRAPKH